MCIKMVFGKFSIAAVLLVVAAVVTSVGLVIIILLKDPDRRFRIVHWFRRGDASVHYSRVSVRLLFS